MTLIIRKQITSELNLNINQVITDLCICSSSSRYLSVCYYQLPFDNTKWIQVSLLHDEPQTITLHNSVLRVNG